MIWFLGAGVALVGLGVGFLAWVGWAGAEIMRENEERMW